MGSKIIDVWASNFQAEMDRLCALAEKYTFVAMDTEFPGVLARPVGAATSPDRPYHTLRCNVDLLRVIQIGLCLSDADGQTPPDVAAWQFNFKFSLEQDMYAQDSIDLLSKSGIDFPQHESNGIDPNDFGELLTSSGLVLNNDIKWITFHGVYDFAYLLKVLTATKLPESEKEFFEILELYFPQLYDMKYMVSSLDNVHGGLNKLAEQFACKRVGSAHQAGSDALLTLHVFLRLVEESFGGEVDDSLEGIIYGLGAGSNLVRHDATSQ